MLLTKELTCALVEDVVDVYLSSCTTWCIGTVADYIDIIGSLVLETLGQISLSTQQVGLCDTNHVRLILTLLDIAIGVPVLGKLPETWEDIDCVATREFVNTLVLCAYGSSLASLSLFVTLSPFSA